MTTFLSTIQPSPPSSIDGSSLKRLPDRIEALFSDPPNPVQQWLGSSLEGKEIRVVIILLITNVFPFLEAPGPDRIHTKYSLGYSAMLDHGAETLTLLDQASTDVHPVESFNGLDYPSFSEVNAQIITATQTGKPHVWRNLCLPDTIWAHDRAFPHAFYKTKMPAHVKSWLLRRQDNDTCLLTGEVAFQAACIMTGEAFSLAPVLEERVQYLEKECYAHEQDLRGG